MSIKILLIPFLLLLGTFQAFSQDSQPSCAKFVNIQQNSGDKGTVDLTFNVKNNSDVDISSVIVTEIGTEGQARPFKIKPFAVSESTFTFTGAIPGKRNCYRIDLLDAEGKVYCSEERCLRTETIVYEYSFEDHENDRLKADADAYISGTDSYIHLDNIEHEVVFTVVHDCCDNFEAVVIGSTCAPEDGSITIQVTGGVPPYESNGIGYVGDPEDYIYEDYGLSPGTYTYTFEDSNGCIFEVSHTIEEVCCDNLVATEVGSGCGPDGWIGIRVSGGVQPYTSDDASDESEGQGFFEELDLAAGTYTYTFEDANGCQVDYTFTIDESPQAEVTIGGCSPNAWVEIQLSGGSGGYTGQGSPEGNGLFIEDPIAPGTYNYNYEDSNGCDVNARFTIPEKLAFEYVKVEGCDVEIKLTGGTPPYWEAGDVGSGGGSSSAEGIFIYGPDEFQGVDNDDIDFIFTDANGCTISVTRFIPSCKGLRASTGGSELRSNTPSEASSMEAVDIYPNPSSDALIINTLNNSDQISKIRIINSAGITLITENFSKQNQIKLDIRSIPSGTYFLEIIGSDNEHTIIEKFVKN